MRHLLPVKLIIVSFFILFLITLLTSCQKELALSEYPNILVNTDITPGENDKEVAVFLYVTNPYQYSL
jgi:hypothetical protein